MDINVSFNQFIADKKLHLKLPDLEITLQSQFVIPAQAGIHFLIE
jgi:hypothetical protein